LGHELFRFWLAAAVLTAAAFAMLVAVRMYFVQEAVVLTILALPSANGRPSEPFAATPRGQAAVAHSAMNR
jgi:hypothetical protein